MPTPWLGWPLRLAATRCCATTSASSSVEPNASKVAWARRYSVASVNSMWAGFPGLQVTGLQGQAQVGADHAAIGDLQRQLVVQRLQRRPGKQTTGGVAGQVRRQGQHDLVYQPGVYQRAVQAGAGFHHQFVNAVGGQAGQQCRQIDTALRGSQYA